jgi:hypothetical protein
MRLFLAHQAPAARHALLAVTRWMSGGAVVCLMLSCGRETKPSPQPEPAKAVDHKTSELAPDGPRSGIPHVTQSAFSSGYPEGEGPRDTPFLSKDSEVGSLVASFFQAAPEQQLEVINRLLSLKSAEALRGVLHISSKLAPGETKSYLCQQLASIDTRDQRDFLLQAIEEVDLDTRRALTQALGARADSAFVLTLVDRFEHAAESRTKSCMLQVLGAVNSRQAIDGLTSLLSEAGTPVSPPVVNVVARVLAQNATAPVVSTLTSRMDRTSDPKDLAELADIIAGIRTPSARSALNYAAKGNRESTLPATRLAAVRALANFPCAESVETLRQLQADGDPNIQNAARMIADKMASILGH